MKVRLSIGLDGEPRVVLSHGPGTMEHFHELKDAQTMLVELGAVVQAAEEVERKRGEFK